MMLHLTSAKDLARVACAGEVDGEVVDLRTVLDKDCTLNILTAKDPEGLRVVTTHLFPCSGRGSEEPLSGCKTCNRAIH